MSCTRSEALVLDMIAQARTAAATEQRSLVVGLLEPEDQAPTLTCLPLGEAGQTLAFFPGWIVGADGQVTAWHRPAHSERAN